MADFSKTLGCASFFEKPNVSLGAGFPAGDGVSVPESAMLRLLKKVEKLHREMMNGNDCTVNRLDCTMSEICEVIQINNVFGFRCWVKVKKNFIDEKRPI